MTPLEQFVPSEVGERLRMARESANLTQAAAADAVGVARTTIVAIEQGQRRVRIAELQKFAQTYRTSVNALLRREAVHVDLVPRFRKLGGSEHDVAFASQLLADLARAESELENLIGIQRTRNYPPERALLPGDVGAQAENAASELRHWLGVAGAPIPHFVTLLEMELGVRVYVRRLDSRISGLFAYDDAVGACMLLNANHPRERRLQTAAHETAHFISARRQPELLYHNEPDSTREERYANAFARALLTPSRSVLQKLSALRAGSDRLTRRHVILLAHFFGVSREAIVRRLEELHAVKMGTWDWFQANGGITDEQVRQVIGDLSVSDAQKIETDRPTTVRLNALAGEASRQGLLSEGQLSRLLHVDRLELRRLLLEDELERGEHGVVDQTD